jgi:aminopeptidase N
MRYFLLLFPYFLFSQQIQKVDFIKCNATVFPKFETKSITGIIEYEFKVLQNIDTIRIDAKNMNFTNLKINNEEVNFNNNTKELLLFEGFKKGKNKLTFNYSAIPKQTLYFVNQDETAQIWTQGQGKYTSYWLPSFDDVNEKVIFNLTVTYNNYFEIISNGIVKHSYYNEELNLNFCKFQMKKPMSSYLVMLAIGKFSHKTEKSYCGIPLENYYKPEDEVKFQYTYKDSKKIFDFLEKKIGVKYPWKIYRQVPVEDFLYAGMENTSSTIFAQDYVVDENGFNDRNYINVNAHELAHQWFGDLVTAKSGKHHWLQEGFATYYALLAEKEIFGEDYFYYQLYKSAQQLKQAAKSDTIPVMNEKASSLSFYQKGAWALFTIKEKIGDKAFDKAIKNYLKKYKYKNVETDDFLNEIVKVSDFDIQKFKENWLEDYRFQNDEANVLLKKSDFINKLLEIQSYRNKAFVDKKDLFLNVMKSTVFYPVKTEIIYQLKNIPFEEKAEIIKAALLTNDIEVRQAVANTILKIPTEFKSLYETLLEDKSYDTKEIAFVNLWNSFPNDRTKYLNLLSKWQGNNDKSTRILYLSYTLMSDFKNDNEKKEAYLELSNYTSPKYESSIRQNAFETLFSFKTEDEYVFKNLVNATTHIKWQFTKYARDMIRELLKEEKNKKIFIKMQPFLSENEQYQLKKLI